MLPDSVAHAGRELVEEHRRSELLAAYNLQPRHRVLLTGPPGNGKTSFAEAIATELAVPLVSVRYESVIASYLGETAVRLSRLFDQVRTRRCVLFFDEFDVVGKERGDFHETGEIKRVVSSLLLQIDTLPSSRGRDFRGPTTRNCWTVRSGAASSFVSRFPPRRRRSHGSGFAASNSAPN